jgi:hypothetical protein
MEYDFMKAGLAKEFIVLYFDIISGKLKIGDKVGLKTL